MLPLLPNIGVKCSSVASNLVLGFILSSNPLVHILVKLLCSSLSCVVSFGLRLKKAINLNHCSVTFSAIFILLQIRVLQRIRFAIKRLVLINICGYQMIHYRRWGQIPFFMLLCVLKISSFIRSYISIEIIKF